METYQQLNRVLDDARSWPAYRLAAHLRNNGWVRLAPGEPTPSSIPHSASLCAIGGEVHRAGDFEIRDEGRFRIITAQFATRPIPHADGRFRAIAFEIWWRVEATPEYVEQLRAEAACTGGAR